ncbi:MepB family protein [Flammeovirga pectinis]|uniref:MepB family protein n=2 Tax=Flammeovirga pectinis TaxID=2494373 RepID=A0A3S9P8Z5_9BACT|nr:MepB family protein [Flammeovirga pectinis]
MYPFDNTIRNFFFKKQLSNFNKFTIDKESAEYNGCSFFIDDKKIIYRDSKITPKKIGQFVTFWKRDSEGITTPFHEEDTFDFYIINAQSENQLGQFIFPKDILIKKGIISTNQKDGKRGFRVYPEWDMPTSKQAITTQIWQADFFYQHK